LADAERLTYLRTKYLAALEEERFDTLPGHAYARAFLRTYARALELEDDLFVTEFDERFPEVSEVPEELIEPVVPLKHRYGELWRALPRKTLVACAALAAVVAAVAWSGTSGSTRPPPLAVPPPVVMPHPRSTLAVAQPVARPQASLVLTATRGPCWLLVRRQSENGPVLYEGTLQPGQSLSFKPQVWLRLGAPGNVNATRGGRALAGLTGASPVDLLG
jgi:Helix-turn-helix domain/RodZ C-terminal domain